jgi:hypothetical protein
MTMSMATYTSHLTGQIPMSRSKKIIHGAFLHLILFEPMENKDFGAYMHQFYPNVFKSLYFGAHLHLPLDQPQGDLVLNSSVLEKCFIELTENEMQLVTLVRHLSKFR